MRVFLTGGTGFVGSHVLEELFRRGHQPRCLVRRGDEKGRSSLPNGVETVEGDATEADTLSGALQGCEAAIHLVGIIRQFPSRGITFRKLHVDATVNVVARCVEEGVAHYAHMSALGARPNAPTEYFRTKFQAEEQVMASGLRYTIFRPSIMFGKRDAFVNMLADMIRTKPRVPVVGNGRYKLQPVAVEHVAQAFVDCLGREECVGKTYEVGGPEALEFNALLDAIGEAIGREARPIHIPGFKMKLLARLLQRFRRFPLSLDQITMLLEGSTCDPTQFYEDFGITPLPFAEGIKRYLR